MPCRMRVGLITLTLCIPNAASLKDKRQVVRSLIDRLRGKFNISAAEIDHLDAWQRAGIGIAIVSNDLPFIDGVLNAVEEFVESEPRCSIIHVERETL